MQVYLSILQLDLDSSNIWGKLRLTQRNWMKWDEQYSLIPLKLKISFVSQKKINLTFDYIVVEPLNFARHPRDLQEELLCHDHQHCLQ